MQDAIGLLFLCHFGSFLEACAFFQTDMVRLRLLEVVARILIAIYAILHTGNAFDCHFIWALVQMLINGGQLTVVAFHYLSVIITEEEDELLASGDALIGWYGQHRRPVARSNWLLWPTPQASSTL